VPGQTKHSPLPAFNQPQSTNQSAIIVQPDKAGALFFLPESTTQNIYFFKNCLFQMNASLLYTQPFLLSKEKRKKEKVNKAMS
jgi:hypothetical protein